MNFNTIKKIFFAAVLFAPMSLQAESYPDEIVYDEFANEADHELDLEEGAAASFAPLALPALEGMMGGGGMPPMPSLPGIGVAIGVAKSTLKQTCNQKQSFEGIGSGARGDVNVNISAAASCQQQGTSSATAAPSATGKAGG